MLSSVWSCRLNLQCSPVSVHLNQSSFLTWVDKRNKMLMKNTLHRHQLHTVRLSRYIRAVSRPDMTPCSAEGTLWTSTLTHRWHFEPRKAILFISCGGGSEEGEARLGVASVIWFVLQRAGFIFFLTVVSRILCHLWNQKANRLD